MRGCEVTPKCRFKNSAIKIKTQSVVLIFVGIIMPNDRGPNHMNYVELNMLIYARPLLDISIEHNRIMDSYNS